MTDSIEGRLGDLGMVLPPLSTSLGNYLPFAISGDLLFLTGHAGQSPESKWYAGKVGEDVSVGDAYDHAPLAGLRMLSIVQSALGSLDRVERVVKLTCFVNSTASFKDHPTVINGCSDLLDKVFGEAGRHTRSAVGASSLPEGTTVEIDAIVKVR
jgi:enamine deaminase RidA (YjgF/YER057c/UK114 family)